MAKKFYPFCRQSGVILTLGASGVFAQHPPLQPVNLRFMDSNTGYALQPQELLVYDPAANRVAASPAPGQVTPEGNASLSLPAGIYWLEAGAAGRWGSSAFPPAAVWPARQSCWGTWPPAQELRWLSAFSWQ